MKIRHLILASVLLVSCVGHEKFQEFNPGDQREPAASRTVLDASGYLYDPTDRSCDGFPRLHVGTMAGTCLGLVIGRDQAMDSATKRPLAMPRTLLSLKGTDDFLLVDMGGWKANNGSLNLLKKVSGRYEVRTLKTGLNLAHGLALSPDGFIYIGESQQISRFHMNGDKVIDWQLVIKDLPRHKGHMHPLTHFTFDPRNGDLFVNSGAPTDHCFAKDTGGYVTCPEVTEMGLGAVYRYRSEALKAIPAGGLVLREQAATGLRNSMAMVVSETGFLIQGENSRDFPEQEEPYEEMNVIDPNQRGLNYGWPQCYNFHAKSPEFLFKDSKKSGLRERFSNVNCDATQVNSESFYQKPHALMPPHVAPLSVNYYRGGQLQDLLGGKLLMSWHGYQPAGHRMVAYDVDSNGRPVIRTADRKAVFMNDRVGGCPVEKPLAPRGGLDQYAPYTEVISGWYEKKGLRPRGAPVGFTVASDGSIWISEDKNRTIVRLARTSAGPIDDGCGGAGRAPVETNDPRIELLAWRNAVLSKPSALAGYETVQTKVIQKYCASCHGSFKEKEIGDDRFSTLDFLVKNTFIVAGQSSKSKIYGAMSGSGEYPAMPPGGSLQLPEGAEGRELLSLVKNWIDGLPTDVEQSFTKIQIGSARDIRSAPNATKSKVCGQLKAGDTIYVDPRASTRPKSDGWLWTKIYLLRGSARVDSSRCAQPEDGVFYIKLKKQ